METIKQLNITKFFDVKFPIGLIQRGETLLNYSIGCDLYVPEITNEFIQVLFEANKEMYPNLKLTEINRISYEKYFLSFIPDMENDKTAQNIIVIFISKKDPSSKLINIYKPVQIPSGIGLNLMENYWCEVRSKSSNFKNGFTVVHGTIDMNYTYGCGIQIIPIIDFKPIVLVPGQKIAQLVIHNAVPIEQIKYLDKKEFENLFSVQDKRKQRTGGFGSTGKF